MLPHTNEMIAALHVEELRRRARASPRARRGATLPPRRARLGAMLVRVGTSLGADGSIAGDATASGSPHPVHPAH